MIQRLLACAVAAAALALTACRSAYGVDPTTDPKGATATPGYWSAELTASRYAPILEEHYRLIFDGKHAMVSALVTTAADGSRHWEAPVSAEAYAAFAKWALALNPYTWADRSSRHMNIDVLRLAFRTGDRGRSVRLENPDVVERGILDRLRELATRPTPAAANAPTAAAATVKPATDPARTAATR